MIDPNIESMDLSDILMRKKKQKFVRMIKIKDYSIEGCSYCNNQISIRYDIHCLEKSIKYWTYKLSKESEKCKGDEWDSLFEMLVYRKEQQDYLKEELVKLKAIYNLD